MKLRKMLPLFVVLVIATVSIFAFFIFRSQPQELATPPENPKPITELEHGDETGPTTIGSVAFSPDDQLLASGGSDGTIILWNINEKNRIKSFEHGVDGELISIFPVTFSPDGKLLASAGKHVKLWDTTEIHNSEEIVLGPVGTTFQHEDTVLAIDFSPDGKLLAAGDVGGNVKIWDIHNKKAIITLQHEDTVLAVDFSPDGKLLAAGDDSGEMKVWDIQNRQVIQTLEVDSKQAKVKFSPDNQFLAVAGSAGEVKLWTLPDWHLQGTLITPAAVLSLAFSPDGKILATANNFRRGTHITGDLNLWLTDSGAHIISLKGHTNAVYSVAFSPDGTTLASGGEDAILRIWNVDPYTTPQQINTRPEVKLIYFLPQDRTPQPDMGMKLDRLVRDVKRFYADEMKRHGFGRKTFDFEKDKNGKAIVYRLDGQSTDNDYLKNTFDTVRSEIDKRFDKFRNVYLVVVDISSEKIGEAHGEGGWRRRRFSNSSLRVGLAQGFALIPASGIGFSFSTTAHELGHAFGLGHDFRRSDSAERSYIMSFDQVDTYQLSECAAEWLDKSRFFNHDQKFYNKLPTIERLPSLTNQSNTTHLRFKVTDADGLHQVHLDVPTIYSDRVAIAERQNAPDPEDWAKQLEVLEAVELQLHTCRSLNGAKTTTVEFELPDASVKEVSLRMIDLLGNIAEQEFDLNTDATEPSEKP